MRTLIIDSNYICYRAAFAMVGLSHRDQATGVIFGFFQELLRLATRFDTNKFIFCFDSKTSIRKKAYPGYKKRGEDKSPEIGKALRVGFPQFDILRETALSEFGFKNIFMQEGLEADDLIADIVMRKYAWKDKPIVVSSDEDLYQLLAYCDMYKVQTKQLYTQNDLWEEYCVTPIKWPFVKALAGCTSDTVGGIEGIGPHTAIKYLNGYLKNGKKYEAIMQYKDEIMKRNLPLVRLPHKLTVPVKLAAVPEIFPYGKFVELCNRYDFMSFLNKDGPQTWIKIFHMSRT